MSTFGISSLRTDHSDMIHPHPASPSKAKKEAKISVFGFKKGSLSRLLKINLILTIWLKMVEWDCGERERRMNEDREAILWKAMVILVRISCRTRNYIQIFTMGPFWSQISRLLSFQTCPCKCWPILHCLISNFYIYYIYIHIYKIYICIYI